MPSFVGRRVNSQNIADDVLMKLALIPPYERLIDTLHTDYQLCLAHLMKPGSYYEKVYKRHLVSSGQFNILDNGAFEGSLINGLTLLDMAHSMNFNEVVIPDCIGNAGVSIEMAKQFKDDFIDPYKNPQEGMQYMFVIQGQNNYEFKRCVDWALDQNWINTIGIPKHSVKKCGYKEARINLGQYISNISDKAIHLLGAVPEWTEELEMAADRGCFRGMDTSMPYTYGAGLELLPSDKIIDRQPDYFESSGTLEQHSMMAANAFYMTGVVG